MTWALSTQADGFSLRCVQLHISVIEIAIIDYRSLVLRSHCLWLLRLGISLQYPTMPPGSYSRTPLRNPKGVCVDTIWACTFDFLLALASPCFVTIKKELKEDWWLAHVMSISSIDVRLLYSNRLTISSNILALQLPMNRFLLNIHHDDFNAAYNRP